LSILNQIQMNLFNSSTEVKGVAHLKKKQKKNFCWFPMKSIIWRKSWNVLIKNLNFFSTEERKTWTSWMTRG